MASNKLTAGIKKTILHNMQEELFAEREETLQAERKALGDQIYYLILGEHAEVIKKLPSFWFITTDSFRVEYHNASYGRLEVPMSISRRAWPEARYYSNTISLPEEAHELADRLMELNKEVCALNEKKVNLTFEVEKMLGQFTTVKKLIEHWPEAEAYLPKDSEPEIKPLAIQAISINAMIEQIKAKAA